jgi:hypothetical protein
VSAFPRCAPVDSESSARGVGQFANFTACSRLAVCFFPSVVRPVASAVETERPPLGVFGVGQPLRDEPKPLPDVERARHWTWETHRPDGVVFSLQVIANKIEPSMSNCCRNLLTKDCCRAALAEEAKPRRPKVARIVTPSLGAGRREGLAGATAGPYRSVVGPAGESKGKRPAANPAEEVALNEPVEISRANIGNTPFIDFTVRNLPLPD